MIKMLKLENSSQPKNNSYRMVTSNMQGIMLQSISPIMYNGSEYVSNINGSPVSTIIFAIGTQELPAISESELDHESLIDLYNALAAAHWDKKNYKVEVDINRDGTYRFDRTEMKKK